MVNFGFNSASILGIFLAVAGASLYFMRSVRPELSRDHDIFFAAVGLLCGFILLFQGWRLDPILQFGQFILAGSTIFFAVEAIRLRGIATEQARRKTPIVDEDRAVSKVYRNAELDELEPYDQEDEQYVDSPRLRGYEEPRSTRRKGYDNGYGDEEPRSRNSRTRSNKYSDKPPSSRKRRPRPTNSRSGNSYDRWDEPSRDVWDEERPSRSSSNRTRPPRSESPSRSQKKRRPRYRDETYRADRYSTTDNDVITTDYVDYNLDEEQERNGRDRDLGERGRDREGGDRDRGREENDAPERESGRDSSNPINFDY